MYYIFIHKSSLADFHQKNILFQNGKTFIEIQSQSVDNATKQLRKRAKKGFIQVDQARFFCFIPVLRKQHGLRRMTQQEATFRSLCALVGSDLTPRSQDAIVPTRIMKQFLRCRNPGTKPEGLPLLGGGVVVLPSLKVL